MSNLYEHAKNELQNLINSKDCYDNLIAKNVLELIDTFSDQGHSGFSAPIVIRMFYRLANFLPLSPLTGEDDEWTDDGQNKRCPQVFKDETGTYDIHGKIFSDDGGESFYSCKESKVYITFPYVVPDKPEKIILLNKETKNE